MLSGAQASEAALLETIHHHERFMARTNAPPGWHTWRFGDGVGLSRSLTPAPLYFRRVQLPHASWAVQDSFTLPPSTAATLSKPT
jgi:hypothetical protein